MKVSKSEIKEIIQEEVTKLLGEMEIPVGKEIENVSDELGPISSRITMQNVDLPTLRKEIRRLAQEKDMSPQKYLESLGYPPQAASNFLGMIGMMWAAEMGMTFGPRQ